MKFSANIILGTIRAFGNRCLSAIGGGNQWSHFAGWVQLSAEEAWPPQSTASGWGVGGGGCGGWGGGVWGGGGGGWGWGWGWWGLMIVVLYRHGILSSIWLFKWNGVLIIGTHLFLFSYETHEKRYITNTKMGYKWDKNEKVSEIWMFILYHDRS